MHYRYAAIRMLLSQRLKLSHTHSIFFRHQLLNHEPAIPLTTRLTVLQLRGNLLKYTPEPRWLQPTVPGAQ
eukprot:2471699-Amphidinium_carterae.3